MTNKEINECIVKINDMLEKISYLGWEIAHELYARQGIENYDLDMIKAKNERTICKQATNCGMINGWTEFGFGRLRMSEDVENNSQIIHKIEHEEN